MAVKVLRTLSMDEANVFVDRLGSPRGPCKSVSCFQVLYFTLGSLRELEHQMNKCVQEQRGTWLIMHHRNQTYSVVFFFCLFVSFFHKFFLVEFLSENQKELVSSE